MVFNLLFFLFNYDFGQGMTSKILRDKTAWEVGVLWVFFSFFWSSGFLKKYLPFSFKKVDQVFNKMLISRGQKLFWAEAFLMSSPVGREQRH